MRKKKWCLIILLLVLLCGCSHGLGHFKDGSIDLTKLVAKINQKSVAQDWSFPILNEEGQPAKTVEKNYQLDMTQLETQACYTSVLPAELGELAFFKCEPGKDAILQQGAKTRVEALRREWGELILEANPLLNAYKEGRIGQYYYVIVGSDAQKVVNYIQSFE